MTTKLHYVDVGTGPVIVLIHGLAGDHTAWTPYIQELKNSYRVIAFDNLGAGRSAAAPKGVTLKDLAHETLSLLDHLKVDSCHVIGRSMGGAVAQEMARLQSTRLESIVLAASLAKLDAMGKRLIENMRDLILWGRSWADWARMSSPAFISSKFFIEQPEQLAKVESLLSDESRDRDSYINLANAVLSFDSTAWLSQIKTPTMIMAGRMDPICSMVCTQWMIDRLPQAQVTLFDDSSHFFLMEEPQKSMATIKAWLGDRRSS
jgi:pimeloyl-ACP methyl ester carboxylesterase